MKAKLVAIVVFLSAIPAFSQNYALKDAIQISHDVSAIGSKGATIPDEKAMQDILSVLGHYGTFVEAQDGEGFNGTSQFNVPRMATTMSELNLAIKNSIGKKPDSSNNLNAATPKVPYFLGIEGTDFGSSTLVSTITAGTINFILQRAQQEAIDAFLQDYQKTISDVPEFGVLFPSLFQAANSYLHTPTSTSSSLFFQEIPTLFLGDVKKLPGNLPKLENEDYSGTDAAALKRKDAYHVFFRSNTAIPFLASLKLADSLVGGGKVPQAITDLKDYLVQRYKDSTLAPDHQLPRLVVSLLLVATISQSVQASPTTWYNSSTYSSLIDPNNSLTRDLYMTFLEDQVGKITITQLGPKSTDTPYVITVFPQASINKMDADLQTLDSLYTVFENIGNTVDLATTVSNDSNLANGDSGQQKQYQQELASLLDSVGQILPTSTTLKTIISPLDAISDSDSFADYDDFRTNAEQTIEFTKYLILKDYHSAFVAILPIAGKFADMASKQTEFKTSKVSDVFTDFEQIGNFASLVASAQSQKDVENAIAGMTPVASYREKFKSRPFLSIDANLGVEGGGEYKPGSKSANAILGLWVPVGLALNAGNGFSVLLAPFDLGALTNFQLNHPNQTLPSFSLYNIISPGIFLNEMFTNTPITVSEGVRLSPDSNSITSSNNEQSGFAIDVFIAVSIDVPLLLIN